MAANAVFENYDAIQNQAGRQEIHGNQYLGPVYVHNNAIPMGADSAACGGSTVKDVLKSLAFPGMLDRRENVAQPHPNTCQWIFDLEEYQQWHQQDCALLYIKGNPGSGKSTMMAFLHRKLRADSTSDVFLDFFLSARGSKLQQTPIGLFRCLLHQLFRQCEESREMTMNAYQEKCDAYGSSDWEWQQSQLEHLLFEAILGMAQDQRVVLFVDALDEAGEQGAKYIARYLHRLNDRANSNTGENVRLKICMSSRHYPIPTLVKVTEIWMERHNSHDIEMLIRDEFVKPLASDYEHNAQQWTRLVNDILKQSQSNFQWVSLLLPILLKELEDGGSIENAQKLLRSLPPELGEVYSYILKNVINRRTIAESFLLFRWVALAARPLTLDEATYVLSSADLNKESKPILSDTPINANAMKKKIKSLSGGLVFCVSIVDKLRGSCFNATTVQVIHQTVKDYLLKGGLAHLSCLSNEEDEELNAVGESDILKVYRLCQSAIYWQCLECLAFIDAKDIVVRRIQQTIWHSSYRRFTKGKLRFSRSVSKSRKCAESDSVTASTAFGSFLTGYATVFLPFHALQAQELRNITDNVDTSPVREIDLLGKIARHQMFSYDIANLGPRPYQISLSSPYQLAIMFGLSSLIDFGIQQDITIDKLFDGDMTLLNLAIIQANLDICKMLLENGALIDGPRGCSNTPLICAIQTEHDEIIALMLNSGANVDLANRDGWTPLTSAILLERFMWRSPMDSYPHVNANSKIRLWLSNMSSPLSTIDQPLEKALETIWETGIFNHLKPDRQQEEEKEKNIVLKLLSAGVNVNTPPGPMGTALSLVAESGPEESVQLLLTFGAAVNTETGSKRGTALQAAVYSKISQQIVPLLLQAGADVNLAGGASGTALKAAVREIKPDIVRMLLDAGADPYLSGSTKGNALKWAYKIPEGKQGREDIIQMLLEVKPPGSAIREQPKASD